MLFSRKDLRGLDTGSGAGMTKERAVCEEKDKAVYGAELLPDRT
ncbi:hypothetical protein [Rhizobium sp. GN54]|nr:hypothetical protein [Rhizobium sp. GN54]